MCPSESRQHTSAKPLIAFVTAVQFLTILPPIIRRPFRKQELGASIGYYPLVGLLLGTLLSGINHLLDILFPSQVSAALLMVVWILLSGALHLDGFLDACDGLFGGRISESRLRIMRDEHMGAFAFSGGVLLLLVKFSALAALQNRIPSLLLAPMLGRWGMTVAIASFPYARNDGLGRTIKDYSTRKEIVLATLTTLIACLLIGVWAGQLTGLLIGLSAMAVAGLVSWLGARFTLTRIPGLTGDIYGALNELIELSILIMIVAINPL